MKPSKNSMAATERGDSSVVEHLVPSVSKWEPDLIEIMLGKISRWTLEVNPIKLRLLKEDLDKLSKLLWKDHFTRTLFGNTSLINQEPCWEIRAGITYGISTFFSWNLLKLVRVRTGPLLNEAKQKPRNTFRERKLTDSLLNVREALRWTNVWINSTIWRKHIIPSQCE